MARYGYARISTRSQRDDSQLDALRHAGCERIWTDTASGRLARRPEWDACLDHLRAGDELVVTRLSRMARSVHHLTDIAATLAERDIDLLVLKQGIDTTTPAGRFTFHVLAAMDEMLADIISEGTKEGLASARARGRVGGRAPKLTARQIEVAHGMYADTGGDGKRRYTVAEIAETFAVSRKTIYRHLQQDSPRRQPDKSSRAPRVPVTADSAAAARPDQRQRRSGSGARLACPTCGHEPSTRPEALQQREDLAIVWLRQEARNGSISQHHHCAQCQPRSDCASIECVRCGDGPIVTRVLADQLHTRGPHEPPAPLHTWLTNHGWQLDPEPLCPAHHE